MAQAEIDMMEMARQCTVRVGVRKWNGITVRRYYEFKVRMRIALWLMRVACIIAGMGFVVEEDDEASMG